MFNFLSLVEAIEIANLKKKTIIHEQDQQVFFVRNHRYRNTVQDGNFVSQSQLRASTPALQTRYLRPALSRGSSQTSVNSTNPFDDDYVDTVSQAGSVDGLSITRSGRKKRRAPQPPKSPSKNMVKSFHSTSIKNNNKSYSKSTWWNIVHCS